jgi:hypothetical protein
MMMETDREREAWTFLQALLRNAVGTINLII